MESFEWRRLLIGEDAPWHYLLEIVLRSSVMYVVLLAFFKITGKRGIKQLSVFDLILIIGLGSAAGDPMFAADVPLLHSVTVFVTILGIYLLLNKLTQHSHKLDVFLEGTTNCVYRDGHIEMETLKKDGLTTMQLFAELRQQSVSHLGQLRMVYLEFSGEPSLYFYPDDKVQPGLPLFPEMLDASKEQIQTAGDYSCVQCGFTRSYQQPQKAEDCPHCGCDKVVPAINEKRVA